MSRYEEFFERHGKKPWTPTFNAHLSAVANDPSSPDSERVLAYAILRSWGKHADCAIDDNGKPLIQSDFAQRLGIKRQRVSEAVTSLGLRNLLRTKDSFLYPVDDPSQPISPPEGEKLSGLPGQTGSKGEDFRRFEAEVWSTQYSNLEREDAELRARREQIKREKLAAYKSWRAAQKREEKVSGLPGQVVRDSPPPLSETPTTSAEPILIEEKRRIEEGEDPPPTPSLENPGLDPEVLDPEPELPDRWRNFELAVNVCAMVMTSADRTEAIRVFKRLPDAERLAAIRGIDERMRLGEYVPGGQFVPHVLSYLRRKLWEAPPRVDRKKAATANMFWLMDRHGTS